MKKEVKSIPMPALQILTYARMMAEANHWPIGRDFESLIRMKNLYIRIASQLN